MHRIALIALASVALAGCSSFSLDSFKSAPPTVNVQLDSVPSGADARTSVGPGCTTPCSVPVAAAENFTVTYTLDRYQPLTVPVSVVHEPGSLLSAGTTKIDPNPVVGELQPAVPPKKPHRRKRRPIAKKPAAAPAAAPPANNAASPFPAPPAGSPAAAPAPAH